ncbi:MAG: hypothetical protein N3B21_02980 [Clostridia bacterium]|nr:hypothetical protein [Clostridia bacterium]
MINVLYIGVVDKKGKFTDYKWGALFKWLSCNCNNIRIYTELSIQQIESCFGKYSRIVEENFPDPDSNLKGYRLWSTDKRIWEQIATSSYKIDSGITHMYFLNDELYKAELAVDDCENFVLLHLSKEEEKNLINIIPSISKNIEECNHWRDHIDYLLDGELWSPLG